MITKYPTWRFNPHQSGSSSSLVNPIGQIDLQLETSRDYFTEIGWYICYLSYFRLGTSDSERIGQAERSRCSKRHWYKVRHLSPVCYSSSQHSTTTAYKIASTSYERDLLLWNCTSICSTRKQEPSRK